MFEQEKILSEYSPEERGAYITAIASIATADHSATADELDFLEELAQSADLSEEQKSSLRDAAVNTSEKELEESLGILKNSELRFSLLTDLVTFAESDENYSQEERSHIEKMAAYLNINNEQLSSINELVKKSNSEEAEEQSNAQGLFGMESKLKNAGINPGGLGNGLLGMLAPALLGGMLARGGGNSGGLGGMLGNLLGGGGQNPNTGLNSGGGLGGMLGNMFGGGNRSGGLGSIISMLNGGRGIGSIGGLLGKLFGKK